MSCVALVVVKTLRSDQDKSFVSSFQAVSRLLLRGAGVGDTDIKRDPVMCLVILTKRGLGTDAQSSPGYLQ